jgi:hypothetical protein
LLLNFSGSVKDAVLQPQGQPSLCRAKTVQSRGSSGGLLSQLWFGAGYSTKNQHEVISWFSQGLGQMKGLIPKYTPDIYRIKAFTDDQLVTLMIDLLPLPLQVSLRFRTEGDMVSSFLTMKHHSLPIGRVQAEHINRPSSRLDTQMKQFIS